MRWNHWHTKFVVIWGERFAPGGALCSMFLFRSFLLSTLVFSVTETITTMWSLPMLMRFISFNPSKLVTQYAYLHNRYRKQTKCVVVCMYITDKYNYITRDAISLFVEHSFVEVLDNNTQSFQVDGPKNLIGSTIGRLFTGTF